MSDAAVILPIGHFLGPFHPGHDAPTDHHVLRIGREPVRLFTEEEVAVWTLAHGLPDRPSTVPGTRQSLVDSAREHGVADAAEVVAELLAQGILAEVEPGGESAVRFAERHRFCPLLTGLGATGWRPDRYLIGVAGDPVVDVDIFGYEVWQWAHLHPDLWRACLAFTAADQALGGEVAGPEEMFTRLLGRVRTLLAYRAGYLDVAV